MKLLAVCYYSLYSQLALLGITPGLEWELSPNGVGVNQEGRREVSLLEIISATATIVKTVY